MTPENVGGLPAGSEFRATSPVPRPSAHNAPGIRVGRLRIEGGTTGVTLAPGASAGAAGAGLCRRSTGRTSGTKPGSTGRPEPGSRSRRSMAGSCQQRVRESQLGGGHPARRRPGADGLREAARDVGALDVAIQRDNGNCVLVGGAKRLLGDRPELVGVQRHPQDVHGVLIPRPITEPAAAATPATRLPRGSGQSRRSPSETNPASPRSGRAGRDRRLDPPTPSTRRRSARARAGPSPPRTTSSRPRHRPWCRSSRTHGRRRRTQSGRPAGGRGTVRRARRTRPAARRPRARS